jgi:predicted hotdog family 3-hydroxylacyl-ACP dehydratase
MPRIDRDMILSLIPHQGTMCLLDEVISWDGERVACATRSHQRADNPLRSHGKLRAIHLCEYGAQAMAVHGGLLAREHGEIAKPGLLVSLRAVQIHVTRIDDLPDALEVDAEKLLDSESSWQYQFRVRHRDALLAEGRAIVMLMMDVAEKAE